ncbi:hypothetical protein ACJX0J_024657, partial [Zea mays]
MPRILDKIIWIADLIFVETHNNGPQVLAGFTGFAEEQDWIHGYIMQFSSIFKLFLCMPLKKRDDVCIIIVIRYKRKMNLKTHIIELHVSTIQEKQDINLAILAKKKQSKTTIFMEKDFNLSTKAIAIHIKSLVHMLFWFTDFSSIHLTYAISP